jgi:hypothetical protein
VLARTLFIGKNNMRACKHAPYFMFSQQKLIMAGLFNGMRIANRGGGFQVKELATRAREMMNDEFSGQCAQKQL